MPTAKKAKDRQPPDSETVDDASKRRPKPHQQLEQAQTTPARAAVASRRDHGLRYVPVRQASELSNTNYRVNARH